MTRLVEANVQADQAVISPALGAEESRETGDDESPGLIDRLAAGEEAFPRWLETVQKLLPAITKIGHLSEQLTTDINRADSQGGGFAARLVVARRIAREMAEPADDIATLGKQFVSQVHTLDTGYRDLIERAAGEVRANPGSLEVVCAFFNRVRLLSGAVRRTLEAFRLMVDAATHTETLSRDLRPPLKRVRQGLTIMIEAQQVVDVGCV